MKMNNRFFFQKERKTKKGFYLKNYPYQDERHEDEDETG